MSSTASGLYRNSFGAVPYEAPKFRQRFLGAAKLKSMTERDGDIVSMYVGGRLDYTTAGEFEDFVARATAATDQALILDLGKVDFIDSAGLRVILQTAKDLRSRDAKLVLCALSDRLRKALAVAGFERLLANHATRAQARASLGL